MSFFVDLQFQDPVRSAKLQEARRAILGGFLFGAIST